MAFIDQIKSLLGLKEAGKDDNAVSFDKKLAAAALMVHVIAAVSFLVLFVLNARRSPKGVPVH